MKTLFIVLVTTVAPLLGLAQDSRQNPLDEPCFVAQHASLKNDGVWRTFAVGDKLKLKLKNDKRYHGRIKQVSQSNIIITDVTEIDVSQIKWIKNTKLRTGNAILGSILTVGGILLFLHVAEGDVDFSQIAPQGGLAVVLTGAGILMLTTHRKFKLEKGDTLTFKEYPLRKA